MIQLSQSAASEVIRLKARRKTANLMFRLRVQPDGCLGLLYSMEFDDIEQADDQIFNSNGIHIVIDANSLNYVNGLLLDYSEDLMGGGFRFHNPNAVQSCGCGNSFMIAS